MTRRGPGTPSLTRRGMILLGAQLAMVGVLGWRLRKLQIDQNEHFFLLAEDNRINIRLIPPARGLIHDREGRILAENRQNYRIVMVREQAGDPAAVLERLATIIPLPQDRRERALRDMQGRAAFVPITVTEHLSWDDIVKVSANAPVLPGVIPEVGLSRSYPHGAATAHVVGYVGPVSEADLARIEDPDPLLQIPNFPIGKTGVERMEESLLRGEAGTSRIEVSAAGRVMRELSRIEGRAGRDLQLTIDLDIQTYALERMQGQSAASVLMDVETGDLIACASAPSFDPNSFVFGISQAEWNGLLNDEFRPLSNKTVSGTYPPGSVFKMVVALAALEAGEIRPGDTVFCRGYTQLGDRRFHCWRRGGHGHMNLRESISQSCDVYYYELARRVGVDRISEMARRFGLGMRHDLPLPAIAEGLMPTRAWKQAVRGEPWTVGDSFNSGIGQGFVLASPIQLAVMTARLATGRAVVPRLVRAVGGQPQAVDPAPDMGLSDEWMARVRDGMYAVTNDQRGTAFGSRILDEAAQLAGKTGTSQVRNISAAERATGVLRTDQLPWNRRNHALFVGYAPYRAPRYAIATVVEHGGGGSSAAAPVARDIMMRALYGPNPPLSAYPPHVRPEIERQRARQQQDIPAPETRPGSDRA